VIRKREQRAESKRYFLPIGVGFCIPIWCVRYQLNDISRLLRRVPLTRGHFGSRLPADPRLDAWGSSGAFSWHARFPAWRVARGLGADYRPPMRS